MDRWKTGHLVNADYDAADAAAVTTISSAEDTTAAAAADDADGISVHQNAPSKSSTMIDYRMLHARTGHIIDILDWH